MTAPVSRTGATDREVEEHDFCCGPGEQFVQKAEDVLWEWVQDTKHEDHVGELLNELLPVVLAYGDARAAAATDRGQDGCSDTCDRRVCEWCPGAERAEAVAQWLYRAVLARQEKVPEDDLRPWMELTKDQRNGWRSWADSLLALLAEQPGGGR